MEETVTSFSDYLNIAKRRRWHMLFAFLGVMVLATILAFGLPAEYRSSAIIMIESQDIPEDLVRSTITTYADERIQRITQRAMTSVNLSRIIDDHDLYANDINRLPRSEIIGDMREDIRMELVAADVIDPRSGRPTKATIAFSISFDYRDPGAAQKVVSELVTLYRSVNLTDRQDTVEGAADFLDNLTSTHNSQVLALEEKLTELKMRNGGALPEFMNANLEIIQRLQRDKAQTEAKLQAVKNRMIFLEAQLLQTDPHSGGGSGNMITSPAEALAVLESELLIAKSQYGPNHPNVVRYKRMIADMRGDGDADFNVSVDRIDEQLSAAETELEVSRASRGEDHPDVVRLTRVVDQLRNERIHAVTRLLGNTVTPAPNIANSINVRAGAGTGNPVVGTVNKGQEVAVIDDSVSGWYQVELGDGTQGFVSRSVVVAGATSARKGPAIADAPSNPAYVTLQANYVQAQSEAESLVGLYRNLSAQVDQYQQLISQTPMVEREYSALLRQLTEARARLQESSGKAESARISVQFEQENRAQNFTLLEPPIAPTEPHWPNRWALMVLGFGLSLMGTLAVAVIAEGLDNSVRTAKDIIALAGAPPLAAIPVMATNTENDKSRRGLALLVGGLIAAVMLMAILIHVFVKPLDVAWFALLRKLGL